MNGEIVFAVLTALGGDRVGIADDIAEIVSAKNCNIEESKMAVLGGEFAVIMLISGEQPEIDRLSDEFREKEEALGLHFSVKPTHGPAAAASGLPYLLETVSQDTQGIVHSVTAVLRRHGVNIEDLETETTPAPWTGAPLFHMRARIILPKGLGASRLRREFSGLEDNQDLHVEMRPLFSTKQE